tara:strand:+ start:1470 stop:1652 length:183 start_codon:yes stop_codon:yes gene_type:complete
MKKKNFINWQLENKEHIQHIYNLILCDLDKYELIINDKKNLYEDIVFYLYQSTYHVKYIN